MVFVKDVVDYSYVFLQVPATCCATVHAVCTNLSRSTSKRTKTTQTCSNNNRHGCVWLPVPVNIPTDAAPTRHQLAARRRGNKRQQRNMPRPFYRCGQAALVLGTCSGAAARQDFATIRNIALQTLDVFVIGRSDLVGAELAHLTARRVTAARCTTRNRRCRRGWRDSPSALNRLWLFKLLVPKILVFSHCFHQLEITNHEPTARISASVVGHS